MKKKEEEEEENNKEEISFVTDHLSPPPSPPFQLLAVGCTCFPLPFLLLHDLLWHMIAVAVSGAFAVTFSVVFAYVSDVTSVTERSSAFGQVSATFAASLVISPALGSLLQSYAGNTAVFALSSIISVIDILFIIFFVPEVCSFVYDERKKRRADD